MAYRNGRFLVFNDSDLKLVYVDVLDIIYFEHDNKYITIATSDYEWTLLYTVEKFNQLIQAIT